MKEKTQRKNRRAYLDNYAKALDGTYIYVGRYLKYKGTEADKKSLNVKLLILLILNVIFTLGLAFTLIGEMSVALYVVIPFVLEIIFTFFTVWYSIKLLMGKDPLKEHIYEQVVGKLPVFSMTLAVFACISLVLCIVFLLTNKPEFMLMLNIIYTVLHALIAAVGILINKSVKKSDWELVE